MIPLTLGPVDSVHILEHAAFAINMCLGPWPNLPGEAPETEGGGGARTKASRRRGGTDPSRGAGTRGARGTRAATKRGGAPNLDRPFSETAHCRLLNCKLFSWMRGSHWDTWVMII